MPKFKITSDYTPTGDQPQAIEQLADGIIKGLEHQVLLGVTRPDFFEIIMVQSVKISAKEVLFF